MRGTAIPAVLIVIAALAASAGAAGGPRPAGQKTGYNLPLGVCDWTIGKTGDPAAFELAAGLMLDGVQVSLVPKGDSLALADPALRRVFLDGGPESAHSHRLVRHRRAQRRPPQERPSGREMARKGDRDRGSHGRQGHPRAVLRQGRAAERSGRRRRRRRRPGTARAEGRGPGRRPGPGKLSQRRRTPEDPRARRVTRRPGLLRRRQLPGRGLSHPRRDPRAGGPDRRGPRQGHQGPLRQGLDGLPVRPQGAGGHRLQGLVRPGGHGDAARRRGRASATTWTI